MNTKIFFHIAALLTAFIWGSTFAASKVLLNQGLSPAEIMILRFSLAYLVMIPFLKGKFFSDNFKDETMFVLCGICAGSLYFLTENTAVKISSASSTVALIVCLTPFLTALVNRLIHKEEKLSTMFLTGSFMALCGTSLVVFNGIFVLDDNPVVIFLSLAAAVCWTIYSLAVRGLEKKYSSIFITGKIFFWGTITMLPYFLFEPLNLDFQMLIKPKTLFCLLFLSLLASGGCYLVWNIVLKRIGVISASNYLYFNPIVALITARIVLDEQITFYAVIGCILTVTGVWLCNKKS